MERKNNKGDISYQETHGVLNNDIFKSDNTKRKKLTPTELTSLKKKSEKFFNAMDNTIKKLEETNK